MIRTGRAGQDEGGHGMDDKELYSLGGMTNSSPAMFDRRRRILHAVRELIREKGLDGFNIRELCRRADVAQRTVHNAFGSKENVLALAIREYFEEFFRNLSFDAPAERFEGALERQTAVLMRNRDLPEYVRAVGGLYFSPTIPTDIRAVLLAIGKRSWAPWLASLSSRQLEPGVNVTRLCTNLSHLQFAILIDWVAGSVPDDQVLPVTLTTVLDMLAGSLRGAALKQVRDMRADLIDRGPATAALLARTRARIAHMPVERHHAAPARIVTAHYTEA